MIKFEIISTRAVEANDKGDKRYVSYMLQVRRDITCLDPNPAYIERRYTHFQQLYNELRKDFPADMAQITFPKKVLMGNFDSDLISSRCTGFEALLRLVSSESRLRDAPATIAFFQIPERNEAKRLNEINSPDMALTVLETSFKVLNKIYTDASLPVLCTLCRIVGCAETSRGSLASAVDRWASLALHRYKAVSDADLLMLYAPLLKACVTVWDLVGKDKSPLEEELNSLHRRGMKIDGVTLSEAVDKLEGSS